MNYHPNKTASQYTTKLNEVIELDGNWEVGLLEAAFPSKADNVLPTSASSRYTSQLANITKLNCPRDITRSRIKSSSLCTSHNAKSTVVRNISHCATQDEICDENHNLVR